MLKMLIRYIFFLFGLLALWSCAGEDNFNPSPQIRVLKPAGELSVNIPDSVHLSAEISDSDTVRRITLNLLDSAKKPVSSPVVIKPERVFYVLDFHFPVTDTLLESGKYFIRITAFDGKKEFARTISVNLQAVPKQVRGFVLISLNGQGFSVDRYSKGFDPLQKRTFRDEYHSSIYYSAERLLFLTAKKNIPLIALHMDKITTQWQKDFVSSFDHHFLDAMQISDSRLYTAYSSENKLVAYSFSGNPVMEIFLDGNYFPGKLALSDEFIFLERVQYGFSDRKLGLFYRQTGGHSETYELPFSEVYSITSLNADSLAMVIKENSMKENSMNKLVLFNHRNQVFSRLKDLEGKPVQSTHMDNGVLLIATSKKLYKYNFNDNRLDEIYTGAIKTFRYDDTEHLIYILTSSEMVLIDAALGIEVNSFNLQQEIIDFHLMYNR